MEGIIVGCDANQEWLLPWWWKHYSAHNDFPVVCVDWGMTDEGKRFWSERGEILAPAKVQAKFSTRDEITPDVLQGWEERYPNIWASRNAFLRKPFALLEAPFSYNLWIDLDCQVLGRLEPIFNRMHLGAEIGVVKDPNQVYLLQPGEVLYNGGVIAFRKEAPILQRWTEMVIALQNQLPTDQEVLARAIFQHRPEMVEFSPLFNWPFIYGEAKGIIIRHFHGMRGKEAIRKLEIEAKT
jgi:hypothetical protein